MAITLKGNIKEADIFMNYILDYNICAIVFLAIIASRYFYSRQFPTVQSRIYGFVLAIGVADVTLDTVSAITIMYASVIPAWVNYLFNTAFYMLQSVFPLMLCYYVMHLSGLFSLKRKRELWLMSAPAIATELYILSNIFTHYIFSIENGVFIHGNGYILLFIDIMFYVGTSVLLLTLRKRSLSDKIYSTVMMCVFFVIAAIVIQYCLPHYLLTSLSIAIALILIYFILENPENMTDRQTGVFSSEAFNLYLRETLELNKPLQLICIELDGMDRFNRFFGFNAGNEAIRKVAGYLKGCSEKVWIFRLTGVRFCIITNRRDEHRILLQSIISRFSQPWDIGDSKPVLSATICHMPEFVSMETDATANKITDLIELSFSESRALGYGAVTEIGEAALIKLCREGIIEQALHDALEYGEGFEVFLQPICDMKTGKFTRAEALLRFISPILGNVTPGEFIPIAERAGLMSQLDGLILKKICEFVADKDPVNSLGIETIELNLSAVDFMRTYLSQTLIATMKAYSVNPEYLCFNITEPVAAASWIDLHSSIGDLASRGYKFALDYVSTDIYNTSFPDISRIATLPFCSVKLGRGIFDVLYENEGNDAQKINVPETQDKRSVLLNGAVTMFHELGLSVTAEGVESVSLIPALKDAEIDFVQGFCYAKPMPGTEFVAFITEHM